MKVRLLLLLTIFALSLNCSVYPSLAFSDEVLVEFVKIPDLVRAHNQHVNGARLLKEATETEQGYLSRSFLPELHAKASEERYRTGSQSWRNEPTTSVEASMNLFRGGRDQFEDKIVSNISKVSSLEAEQTFRYELSKARTAYWNLVAQKEIQGVLRSGIKSNKEQLKAAQDRVNAGLSLQTDELEFKLHQVELEQEEAKSSLAIKRFELELAVLLGFSEQTGLITAKYISHDHSDELANTSFSELDHLAIQVLEHKSVQANLEKLKAEKWWIPSIDLYASYGLNPFREREFEDSSDRLESIIGAQVSIGIYDGLKSKIAAAKKSKEVAGYKADRQQTSMELKAEFEHAKAQLSLTHQLIHKSEDALKISGEYLEQTIDEYKKGVKNSPDVLSALEKDLTMRLSFVDLRRGYEIAKTNLMAILGI